jgi:hypothetical protein
LLISLVPRERFELPTNGLQIRPSSSLGFKQKESKNNQMLDRGAFFMSQSLATATIGFQRFSDSGGSSTRHETRHGSVRAPIVVENRLIRRPLLSLREPPTAVQCSPEDAILSGNVLVAQKQLPIPGSGDVWQGACPLHQSPLRQS